MKICEFVIIVASETLVVRIANFASSTARITI